MFESFNGWFESVRFACEVQGVISMRLMRMAQGGPDAAAEANLMIAENKTRLPTPKWRSPKRCSPAKV